MVYNQYENRRVVYTPPPPLSAMLQPCRCSLHKRKMILRCRPVRFQETLRLARSRVYRHDVRCPDCGSNRMRRDGFTNDQSAYRCGDGGRRYVPQGAERRPGAAVQARGLAMDTAGSSLSASGRVLGYSAAAPPGWVKKGAPSAEPAAATGGGTRCGISGPTTGGGGVRRRDVDLLGRPQ